MFHFTRSRIGWALVGAFSLVLAFGTTIRAADDDRPDARKLTQDLLQAYNAKEYKKALKLANQIHEMQPGNVDMMYNIGCLHCLMGDKDKAYAWLEKAIDKGYNDADHLVTDSDFKTIRGEDRFRALVKRARGESPEEKKSHKATEEKKPERPDDDGMSLQERFQKMQALTGELIEVSNAGKREKALGLSIEALDHAKILYEKLHDHEQYGRIAKQQLSLTNYNVACMYALVKKKDRAFKHLAAAIKAGGFGRDLVGQIEGDSDLDSLRKDERYAKLLAEAKKLPTGSRRGGRAAEDRPKADNGRPKTQTVDAEYRVTLPEKHHKNKSAPLLVMLHHYHGSMDRTTDRWKKAASEVGAILLTPQGTERLIMGEEASETLGSKVYSWGRDVDKIERNIMKAINAVMDEHKIDEDRVILGGFSQGGAATWALALRNPDAFAGIIPFGGSFKPESESQFDDEAFKGMRVYIMIGEEEPDYLHKSNREGAERFKKAGAKVHMRTFEETGHSYPENTFEEQMKALRFVMKK